MEQNSTSITQDAMYRSLGFMPHPSNDIMKVFSSRDSIISEVSVT